MDAVIRTLLRLEAENCPTRHTQAHEFFRMNNILSTRQR